MITPLEPEDPRSAGEFRLRARLGTGGMGQVFLGYSPGGRAVAVKVCHPEFAADPSFTRRFEQEVAAARSVGGIYTAQVIGAGPHDDPPWLATVYVPGPSLYDTVRAHGPLPWPATWRLAAGLAEALRDIHARGLVHRDLKPTNVLLAPDGPRVIDFGVARAAEATSLTTTGMAFGTPAYMSPEQAEGKQAGPASDVFSLGCVLCYAATGGTPYGDGPPPTLLYRIVHTQPELGAVPASMRPLVTACLDKDPARRPTLTQILQACQAAGTGPEPEAGGTAPAHPGAAGQGAATAPGFWPADVAAVITRYQAALDQATRSLKDPGDVTQPVGGGRHAAPQTTPVTWRGTVQVAVKRRGVVGGLAGLTAAVLGAGAWELSRAGGHSPAQDLRFTGHNPGQLVWSGRTGGAVTSGAVLAGGVVYIGSSDHHVYGYDAATGALATTFPLGGAVTGGLAQGGGIVYAGCADHMLYALPAGGGPPAWTAATSGPVDCTPGLAAGVVYTGSDDGYVYAFSTSGGGGRWRYRTGGAVRSRPLPGRYPWDGYLYVGSGDGWFYALGTGAGSGTGPATGKLGWRYHTGGAVNSGAVQDSQAGVYVGSDRTGLFELLAQGGQQWQFGGGGSVRTDPVLSGDAVYIGSADGHVYAVDSGSGAQIWGYQTGGPVSSGIAIDGNVLYAGSDDGYLYAIDITSQALRWRFRAGGAVRSRIIVAGGLVYFGSLDHKFYAVKAS